MTFLRRVRQAALWVVALQLCLVVGAVGFLLGSAMRNRPVYYLSAVEGFVVGAGGSMLALANYMRDTHRQTTFRVSERALWPQKRGSVELAFESSDTVICFPGPPFAGRDAGRGSSPARAAKQSGLKTQQQCAL
eukprot:5062609-Prymnesium_polylepis.1